MTEIILQEPLSHAYLFGLDAHARVLAALVVLKERELSEILTFSFSQFGIDEAREIKQVGSMTGDGRKYVVLRVEMITEEAQHALLKTFEDVAPGTHFFLSIARPDALLPTLRSRFLDMTEKEVEESDETEEKFLTLTLAKKFAHITALLKKYEDEPVVQKAKAESLLRTMIVTLSKSPRTKENAETLSRLLDLSKSIFERGANVKQILETAAILTS